MIERDEDGRQPCRRETWCMSSVIINDKPDGSGRRVPEYGPRPFCQRDADLVQHSLEELPGQYAHLVAEMGNPSARARPVRVPFGPRVPIRVDIDVILHLLAESLISWHERIAVVDHLHFPEGHLARMRRDGRAIQRAVDVIAPRFAALIALPPEPMVRATDLRDLGSWLRPAGKKPQWVAALPDDTPGVVHAAFAEIVCDLDGGDAGMEILNLRHLCRAVLGETKAKPDELIGVPCRADGCGLRALVRAEPPSDPSDAGHYSECLSCGDKMDDGDYGDWVALCAAYERNRIRVPALGNLPGAA